MHTIKHWLMGFIPAPMNVNLTEKLRASLGALLGILATGVLTTLIAGEYASMVLIAPMGASAVLLFAVPASPLAQPWSILGGNLVAALIGITCASWIQDTLLAAALAVGLSIALMFILRCLHPPSGAVALTTVLGWPEISHLGYTFALLPVSLNSLLLLMMALLYNNLTRRAYPHHATRPSEQHHTLDIPAPSRFGFTVDDLDQVLKQHNQVVDISRDDLQNLFLQTEMHVYQRKLGEITCADIMSRDVRSVEFGTLLEEAWSLLRIHHIKALPVIDRANRVIGIVSQIDLMKEAQLDIYEGFDEKLKRFIRRTTNRHSDKPEVVGQIMTKPAITAREEMHIVELIPLISQHGIHHLPVVNHENRLVGIVTQSDLIAALYSHVRELP